MSSPNADDTGGMPVEVTRTTESSHDDVLVPPVDIHETDDGWVLLADVPGVGKDGLDVEVHKGVLTIHGRMDKTPIAGRVVHQEFRRADYFRSFPLSDQVDRDRIVANVSGGVVTITLPKAQAARPRKIMIEGDD